MKRFGIVIFIALIFCAIIIFAQEASKTKEPIQPFGKVPVSKVPIQRYGPQPAEQPFGQIGSIGIPSSVKQPMSGNVPFSEMGAVGTPQSVYQPYKLDDFKGGLDLSTYKTKVPPDRAIVLENVLWNEGGDLYKRPGYDTLKTTPEVFNFLYRYYQQDGDKYLMGGSDTALYFWEEDSSAWTYLIGTEGTSGRWDGTTFEDAFVGTHEGIQPVIFNGDTLYASFTEFADTFVVERSGYIFVDDTTMTFCHRDTHIIKIPDTQASWESQEWDAYTVRYPLIYSSPFPEDTFYRRDLVSGNTEGCLYFTPGFNPAMSTVSNTSPDNKFQILSIFGVDSVWREGMADSVIACEDLIADQIRGVGLPWRNVWECINQVGTTRYGYDHYFAKIFDDTFAWDSTFNYDDYIFEVTDGAGLGSKCYLGQYFRTSEDLNYGWSNSLWNTSAFFVYAYSAECFDSTTEYRIYAPIADQQGAKFVETFDARLWLGWTGLGEEQNKNAVIYSKLEDMGNWPPENDVYLTPDDGDWITGMKSLSDARHVDVPAHLLMVTKNASSYKIIPTSTAGLYDSWYISTRVGCVSNSAMSVGEGLVLFPDQSGVWAWDQRNRPQCISLLIDPIFEAWDFEELEKVSAIYNPQDRHYYLSYPSGEEIEHEGFLVSYAITPGGVTGIYTQELDSDGAQVDTQYKDLNNATGYHDLGSNPLGRYIHVWQNTVGDNGDIWLQRFNEDRSMVGDSILVNDDLLDPTNYEPTADMNQSGDIVVVWQDDRQETAGTNDIYGQILSFATGKVGGNFVLNECYETNTWDCGEPDVDINDDGFFVVVWQEYSDYGGTTPCCTSCVMEILGQRYSVSGGAIGSNFGVNDCGDCVGADTVNSQKYPSVAVGDDSAFVVVWESTRGGNTNDVWKQEFTSAGAKVDCDVMISPVTYTYSGRPEIAINDSGLYVITWIETNVPSGEIDVFASTFNADHSVKTSGFKVNEDAGNAWDDNQQQVAINTQGNYVVVWADGRNATDDIFAQVYNFYTGTSGSNFCINDYPDDEVAQFPEIKCFGSFIADYNCATLAWNIDYHGWSEQSFSFSAIEYQHGLTDPVKVLFADPDDAYVYNYGTQADDVDDAVILTYQSPYFALSEHYPFRYRVKAATVESYLDTGTVYLDWHRDYSVLAYQDSLMCGADCWQRKTLSADVRGKNVSVKLITGSQIDTFILSRIIWEYLIE